MLYFVSHRLSTGVQQAPGQSCNAFKVYGGDVWCIISDSAMYGEDDKLITPGLPKHLLITV